MRIGLDFDNTIVSYDSLFHAVAVEKSLVPAQTPVSKVEVRDYLRAVGNEPAWTELQGYVYGARMDQAEAYPGFVEFVHAARENNVELVIVSHKTKYPFLGPQYDLHAAAGGWIASALRDDKGSFFPDGSVFFELTKEAKIARIAACRCDYFIDDLPEILRMPGFPVDTGRLLFDPEQCHGTDDVTARFGSWYEIKNFFEQKWLAQN
ncbi:hypothetical protein FHW67_002287 [Herbaspirillum sp. Sphag1AN]|uniref:haloacid dehalogenase-like hydrolase n=1 Tax=unclassified Herbaspirillum TaxID=2624150 RepID=UPI00162074D7|nr:MULTISPECIES: haloacid dehalogenase-like hydrolase [unclassified Herbaspirillum]MBB3212999.1 hypothetical protein [Herbaspirillum sp. Sphag1AN]MBB3246196.1 hypothetical protein [Herbaspirillum sp. Sphag64]